MPYARRYFEGRPEDSDEQLFLDCCALVRRACHDLRDEFGFVLGRGNQAYQYCTLPETAHTIEELSPGDLIFYEGEYVKEGAKQQILGMVHVEVFWGGESGRATIGARKPDGYVEIHDDYAFTAKKWKTHRCVRGQGQAAARAREVWGARALRWRDDETPTDTVVRHTPFSCIRLSPGIISGRSTRGCAVSAPHGTPSTTTSSGGKSGGAGPRAASTVCLPSPRAARRSRERRRMRTDEAQVDL